MQKPKKVEIDSSKPIPIDENEELERIDAMLQRDNLIRSLGVYDQVHRMLCANSDQTGTDESQKVLMYFC